MPDNLDLLKLLYLHNPLPMQRGGCRGDGSSPDHGWKKWYYTPGKAKYVEVMYDALLGTVERFGRTYEVGLVMQNNLKSGKLFNNADMGMPMFQRGKLKLLPTKVQGAAEVARIFAEVRKMEGGVK